MRESCYTYLFDQASLAFSLEFAVVKVALKLGDSHNTVVPFLNDVGAGQMEAEQNCKRTKASTKRAKKAILPTERREFEAMKQVEKVDTEIFERSF